MPGAVLRLRGRRAEVRSDDDVVAAEQRVLGEGLRREDVEGRAADLARLEAGLERIEVDELAARAVDDPHAVLHLRDRLGVDPVDRVRRLRQVDRDDVGLGVELIRRLRALDAQLAEALGGDELVEGDHLHLERLRALGDQLADPPEADHAERLAVELVAGELASAPTRRRRGRRVAWGTLRHRASARASVCSAAATEFDSGALTTTIPRLVAASTSTLSTPVPARPITLSREARSIRSAVSLRRRADDDPVELADALARARRPTCRARARRRSPRAGARRRSRRSSP